jgi:hypothetical protein
VEARKNQASRKRESQHKKNNNIGVALDKVLSCLQT